MAIWDNIKQGIDKAGKAAQDVMDEGKLRIDAYRAREQADKAAEALGYALFRSMDSGHELESSARERLVTALRERDTEAKRLEAELVATKASDAPAPSVPPSASAGTPPHAPNPPQSSASEPSA